MSNIVALDAPTGWGKTLPTLIALKETNMLPALWLVRSLTIGSRVSDDASLLGLRCFIAAGRGYTCLVDIDSDEVHEYCRVMRHRCRYFLGLDEKKIPEWITSYIELVREGKARNFCPYYAQDFRIRDADVIVQNYHRRRQYAKVTVVDLSLIHI